MLILCLIDDTQLRLTWHFLVSALIDAGSGTDAATLAGRS
jgi:hypothetical protein